jgi:hypothetical protein
MKTNLYEILWKKKTRNDVLYENENIIKMEKRQVIGKNIFMNLALQHIHLIEYLMNFGLAQVIKECENIKDD